MLGLYANDALPNAKLPLTLWLYFPLPMYIIEPLEEIWEQISWILARHSLCSCVGVWTFRHNIFFSHLKDMSLIKLQVILFEINWGIFYTNLHELFCQFISWSNWVNSGKFMDNCWISCQVMADMKKVYNDLIIINLYI